MTTSRRDFVRVAATSTGALGLGLLPSFATRNAFGIHVPSQQPKAKLRILVLGGTSFIGPYQVQYALDRGHTITLFNRGKTNPQLFPGVEKLIGDRNGDLKSLEGREWDVVIDNSATQPKWVELTASLLQKSVKRYVFTSTRSVYFDTSIVPMTAAAPVYTPENTKVEPGKDLPYGLAKAESEKTARKYFPNGALIVRPSLIVGPGDLTDRYTYWPVRIERGGEILAPGDGSDRVQVIDVRDLCEWMVRLCENGVTGTYNGLGPKNGYSFAELLHGIKAVTSSDAMLTWVDTDFLTMMDVRGYREMPVWQPSRGRTAGFGRFDITPELALGLTFRPLAVTAKDTLDYYHAQPADRQATLRAGITPEREKEVLAAWKARAR
jgi:nucleoside-diphosphate-sugar epimerase